MDDSTTARPQPVEHRRSRRFVAWFILTFIGVWATLFLSSIGITIYRNRHPASETPRVGIVASPAEMFGCHDSLGDITHALEKHLESFHTLLDRYDRDLAQQWADEGDVWRGQWKLVGKRCRFDEVRGGKLSKELESMAVVHAELGKTEKIYSDELHRFGREQAPRLDGLRARLQEIGELLSKAHPEIGDGRP